MTEKPDNTEEAVAWRAKNYQGEPWTVAPCEFSKRHYQRIEPLFPLSSLETRDARIAVAEAENVKLRALAEESIRLMTKYAREADMASSLLKKAREVARMSGQTVGFTI